jgi:hypothetical protein
MVPPIVSMMMIIWRNQRTIPTLPESYRRKLVTARIGRVAYRGVLDVSTSPPKERYAVSNDNVVRLIQPSTTNSPKSSGRERAACLRKRWKPGAED